MGDERADLVLVEGEWKVILILKAEADPQRRQGYPARDPDYRLKLALKRLKRDLGLKCESVRDHKGERIDIDDETEEHT